MSIYSGSFTVAESCWVIVTLAPQGENSTKNHYSLERNLLLENGKRIAKINAPIVEISSTFIRKNIASGNDIRPMLPKNVWEYLDEMNFYK